jgi:PTH1 family peptidyl-tRNA hydrolase
MFRKKQTVTEPPTWMIVGLGNPGAEYRHTRHNVGFDLIDLLGERYRIPITVGKSRSILGVGRIGDTVAALVKPLTFMNRSGEAVAPLARSFGILPEQILVVADDLDLEPGVLRLRLEGSSGGHNGHKSVSQSLNSTSYPRLRIGIGANKDETIDHVLSKFKPAELDLIHDALDAGVRVCELVVEGNWSGALEAVTAYNKA